MKKILSIFGALAMLIALPAKAEFNYGVSIIIGQADTDGSETEKTVSGVTSEVTNKSIRGNFYGGSIFAEYDLGNGFVVGLDYVPLDLELGSASRTDSDADHGGADSSTDVQTGTRTAEANVENLITIYTHVPLGPVYGVLGYHNADITTDETLPTSTYGDASVNGVQLGLGLKGDRIRAEIVYSDFDSIELSSSANSTQKIKADADATAVKISYSF